VCVLRTNLHRYCYCYYCCCHCTAAAAAAVAQVVELVRNLFCDPVQEAERSLYPYACMRTSLCMRIRVHTQAKVQFSILCLKQLCIACIAYWTQWCHMLRPCHLHTRGLHINVLQSGNVHTRVLHAHMCCMNACMSTYVFWHVYKCNTAAIQLWGILLLLEVTYLHIAGASSASVTRNSSANCRADSGVAVLLASSDMPDTAACMHKTVTVATVTYANDIVTN
jgi:hypothetical protein